MYPEDSIQRIRHVGTIKPPSRPVEVTLNQEGEDGAESSDDTSAQLDSAGSTSGSSGRRLAGGPGDGADLSGADHGSGGDGASGAGREGGRVASGVVRSARSLDWGDNRAAGVGDRHRDR